MNTQFSNILVSIVVPVYNVEKYLPRCLESLLTQTHTNIEIILVDDGSTDNCSRICDDFAANDERVVVLRKRNEGRPAARNSGIDLAKGEWIGFVDGDDFVSERFVEYLLAAAVENEALLARCKSVKGIEEKLAAVSEKPRIKIHDLANFFIHCSTAPGHRLFSCCVNLCHISVFDKIRFPALKHTEDGPAAQECFAYASQRPLVTVEETLYYWYQRRDGLTNGRANLDLLDQSKAFEIVLDFWREKNEFLICEILQSIYFACLIDGYARLRRDAPALRDQYEHLVDKIKVNLPIAIREAHKWLVLPVLRFGLFDYLQEKTVVMYGYGENGRKIWPWLEHFGVNVCEIWDAVAPPDAHIADTPFVKMHGGLASDTVILQTVEDQLAALSIKRGLFELGYSDIIEWQCVWGECRRRIYEEFLPFLLG
ncbi:MAG: glycosyltransferase family 2 protein [Lachnospiraceae bacterium]|jgi:glycosyltransferase involved in cell wall biosynthesis|nr:glycosyltransferase family 2 protein [Lachnospiraceae bacterium]